MADLQKRFIFGSHADWFGAENANKEKFYDSIVFIKDDEKDTTKGVMIYTHGVYFEMSNEADVKNIINEYLPGTAEGNIEITYTWVDAKDESKGKELVIKEKSTGDFSEVYALQNGVASVITEGADSQLVQVKAVADALTIPMSLEAKIGTKEVGEGEAKQTYTTATFTQNFTKLNGEEVSASSAVLVQGENVTFKDIAGVGVEISSSYVDTKYGIETGNYEVKVDEGDEAITEIKGASINLKGTDNSTDTINIIEGQDISVRKNAAGDIVIASTYVAPEETVYKGQEAIVIDDEKVGGTGDNKDELTGNKIVTLKIDSSDHVLTQSSEGLKTTLTLNYDSATNKVQLLGNEYKTGEKDEQGKDITSNVISEFDASAFVKDRFLDDASFVTVAENEIKLQENKYLAAGEYLKLVFKTVETDTNPETEKTTKTVYLPVSDLVKTGTMSFAAKGGEGTDKDELEFKFDATVGKYVDGANLATALNSLDSDLDATKANDADANEIAVVTGVTQVNGKITKVDSGLAATKTYVDTAIEAATPTGELTLTNPENGSDYVFGVATEGEGAEAKVKDGFVKASDLADILNAAWGWGEIK